jgi:ligand-binding SRPBCC domain-containing protein
MKSHYLVTTTIIDKPIGEMFDFFSKAENLNKITPPELSFNILTPLPFEMKKGTLIDYKIKLNGIPMKWKTKISVWEPPFRFIDEQLKGPYVKWIHEHRFESLGNKTRMTDTIEYLSPGWILEPVINKLFVENKVKAIFNYRETKLKELFR